MRSIISNRLGSFALLGIGVRRRRTALIILWTSLLSSRVAAATEAATISDLLAIPTPGDGQTVIVQGYYQRGDGGGGSFYWDAASTAPTNRGTMFASRNGGSGRWMRIFSGALNVRWFGAKGDGSQDEVLFLQNAIDSLPVRGGAVYIPAGDYLLAKSETRLTLSDLGANLWSSAYHFCLLVSQRQNIRISGDGASSRLFVTQAKGQPYQPSDPSLLALDTCTNCDIESLCVVGAGKRFPGSDLRNGVAIFVHNSTGIRVTACMVQDAATGILGWGANWSQFCGNRITGIIAQSGIEFYNNGTGNTDHNIVANNMINGGPAETVAMGIRPDCGYSTFANNTIRGANLEAIVLDGVSNRFECISGNTIETSAYYGIEVRSAHHSVLLGNALDGGGADLVATGLGKSPPAYVRNNVLAANIVLGGRSSQAVYLGTARPTDVTVHNLICDNMVQTKSVTFGIQAGNARFNQISGNNISRVNMGVVLDAPDSMVDGNSVFTTMHGIYASNFGLREFVHGNYLFGKNAQGSAGVFLNQSYTDAYVVDNEDRGFVRGDILSVSPSSTFSYSSRYTLALQPTKAAPAMLPGNSPGTIYMNPDGGLTGADIKGNWHPLW
jgi:hypothetical protein